MIELRIIIRGVEDHEFWVETEEDAEEVVPTWERAWAQNDSLLVLNGYVRVWDWEARKGVSRQFYEKAVFSVLAREVIAIQQISRPDRKPDTIIDSDEQEQESF